MFIWRLLLIMMASSSSSGRSLVAMITGTSKGIGLGLTKQLLERPLAAGRSGPTRVVACCRTGVSAELQALQCKYGHDRLVVLQLDVRDMSSHISAKKHLLEFGIGELDIIVCNAGISNRNHPIDPFFECTEEDMMDTFSTNAVGTLFTLQQFAPLCIASGRREKLCCVLSSRLASIEQNIGGYTSYRTSKASTNMIAKTFSEDASVRDAGVKTLAIHPGWVKTDMGDRDGTRGAPLTVDDSAAGIFDLIDIALSLQVQGAASHDDKFKNFVDDFLRSDKNISFVSYNGELLPW